MINYDFDIPINPIRVDFDFNQRSSKSITFRQFIKQSNRHYKFYPYLENLIELLQRVADGELNRLMVFMPPRHGKSELVSRLFPAYYLSRYSDRWVALVSYGAELSNSLSRNARDNYLLSGNKLKSDAATIKNWETGQGGGLWATGIGGSATGKGFNLGIIDDPIKDATEAYSPTVKRRNEDWLNSVFWTRREPINAIITVCTRWGKNDPAGYLLSTEHSQPEYWHIVHNEAIKEDDSPEYPETCTIEPDNRQPGQALSPQWPIDELEKIRSRSIFWFNALYQQSPKRRQGRVYHQFSGPGVESYELDLAKASGYYHSHDFGAVNHVYGIWARIEGKYYLIHEERLPEMTTSARANKVKSHLEGRKVIAGWGGAKSERQYRMDFTQAGLSIRTPPMASKGSEDGIVEAQIRLANSMLAKGTMIICADMTMTLDQLENCVRDEKGGIADKASWHFLDMVRYFAAGINRSGWGR